MGSSPNDMHNAFLHGDLEEEVYMKLPSGSKTKDADGKKVCKLRKSIYELKQSPRCWFSKLAGSLKEYGFTQHKQDYSLFSLKRGGLQLYVIVYVDDLVIGGNDKEAVNLFKEYLEGFRLFEIFSWIGSS